MLREVHQFRFWIIPELWIFFTNAAIDKDIKADNWAESLDIVRPSDIP